MNSSTFIDKENISGSRCILVGLFSMKDNEIEEKFDSLMSAVELLGGKVVGHLFQRRGVSRSKRPGGSKNMDKPMDSATYIGKGKVEKLKELVDTSSANTIVFLNKLSSTQARNLSEITGCKIISDNNA